MPGRLGPTPRRDEKENGANDGGSGVGDTDPGADGGRHVGAGGELHYCSEQDPGTLECRGIGEIGYITGSEARDEIRALAGNNFVKARGGEDLMHSNGGDLLHDNVMSNLSDDELRGGCGSDLLVDGRGNDELKTPDQGGEA